MGWCPYQLLADGRLRCPVCGDETRRKWGDVDPAQWPHNPCGNVQEPTLPCAHLGGETRRVPCEGCGGVKTKLKVYACAVHGECTFGKVEGVVHCLCGNYQAPPRVEPQ